MARELNFGHRAARSGQARSMVVFLHGYGANGADLLGLALLQSTERIARRRVRASSDPMSR